VEETMIFGLNGLDKLHYQGATPGVYVGKCTGVRYEVSLEKPGKWVDKRDVAGLLALHDTEGKALWLAS
jgi:hypothetical protein